MVCLVGSCDIVTGMLDIWEAYTPMFGFVNLKELLSWGLHSWGHLNCSERVINSCFKRSSYCSRIDKSLEYLLTTERCMFRLLIVLGCGWTTPSLVWDWDKNFLYTNTKPRDFCYVCSVFFESWMLWILLFLWWLKCVYIGTFLHHFSSKV